MFLFVVACFFHHGDRVSSLTRATSIGVGIISKTIPYRSRRSTALKTQKGKQEDYSIVGPNTLYQLNDLLPRHRPIALGGRRR